MIATAMASCERIFELMDIAPQVQEVVSPAPVGEIRGEVEFRNVSFKYAGSDEVLRDFSLHVRPGETVALVGPTGAGKTTVINVLCRFYDITAARSLSTGWTCKNLPEGLQATDCHCPPGQLIFRSIEENIKYGRADATRDQVIAVAKAIDP